MRPGHTTARLTHDVAEGLPRLALLCTCGGAANVRHVDGLVTTSEWVLHDMCSVVVSVCAEYSGA